MRSVSLLLVLAGWGFGCSSGKSCGELQAAYDQLLSSARQCTVGADNQCGVVVAAGFTCCSTHVNGRADELAAIIDQGKANGCQAVCNGVCLKPGAFACQADSASSTGGLCKPQGILDLTGADDGGVFSVAATTEVDIVLQDVGANTYATQVLLSSDAATVLEVTIPAGSPDPGGLTHLYRIGAVSAGQVVAQTPRSSATSDAAPAAFTVTLDIH